MKKITLSSVLLFLAVSSLLFMKGINAYFTKITESLDNKLTVEQKASYTVVHEIMDLDGTNYTVHRTQTFDDVTIGETVTPAVLNIEGFDSPQTQTVSINSYSDTVVTYRYTRKQYTLTITNSEHVTTDTPSGTYYYGAPIHLVADADDGNGHDFVKWSNNETNPDYTFQITGNTTIGPIYAETYTITYVPNNETNLFTEDVIQKVIIQSSKEKPETKKYNIIFEAMIDDLIGTPHDEIPQGLAEQDDEKRVDHLYTDLALTSSETDKREVYYIGDSKYYKMSTSLGKSSIAKQYTYARNVIQWNIDMWKDNAEGRRMRNETSDEFRRVRLRPDSITEGYDIIPNFFLSADVDPLRQYNRGTDADGHDLNIHPRIENGEEKTFVQSHFDNRLFDRDSLLLLYYDVNFLFIVRMYARNNAAEKAKWKAKVREIFRKRIQKILADKYHFYALAPKPQTYAEGYMQDNLKTLIGKVYQPFDNPEMYVLALDNQDPQRDNAEVLQTLGEHFFITNQGAYMIGQDPTLQLQAAGYTQGADEPVLADEYILLSTIDSKANADINALINGNAATFVSGYRPSDKVDLQSIKYVGVISNHKVLGAYQVRSINVAYIENAFRLKFNLGEYRCFKQPIVYGLDKYATPGVALNVAQLADRANISPTPKRFIAFFE